jgi:hypothetical protein
MVEVYHEIISENEWLSPTRELPKVETSLMTTQDMNQNISPIHIIIVVVAILALTAKASQFRRGTKHLDYHCH